MEDEDPGDEEERVPIRKKFVLARDALISLMGPPVMLPKGSYGAVVLLPCCVPLHRCSAERSLSAVLAMFPDTTTFYQAVVLHPPKKHSSTNLQCLLFL